MHKKITAFFHTLPMAMLVLSVPASANLLSQDLVKIGAKYYQAGDYPKAIHELSKALLADPQDQEARGYLEKMGLTNGIYQPEKTGPDHIADLAHEVVGYQDKVLDLESRHQQQAQMQAALQEENVALQEAVLVQDMDNAILQSQLEETQSDAEAREREDEQRLAQIQQEAQERQKEIARLNADMFQLKDSAVESLTATKEKAEQVNALQGQLKKAQRDWREKKIEYDQQLALMDDTFKDYKHHSGKSQVDYKKQLKLLQQALINQRQELGRIKDKWVLSDYKLADREAKLAHKNKRMAELQASIGRLEREIAYFQERAQPEPVAAISVDRSDIDNDKIAFIKKQDRLIAELKEKLITLQNKESGTDADQLRSADQDDIAQLKAELDNMKLQIQEKESLLASRVEDNQLLQEQLEDTRERINSLEEMIQKKDVQIADLEKQLTESIQPENTVIP